MAVEVEGDADGRMPKPFLRDLRVYAVRKKMGRMCVPEIMKPDAGQVGCFREETDELMGKTGRLQRASVFSADNIDLVSNPDAHLEKFFGLLGAVATQLLDD